MVSLFRVLFDGVEIQDEPVGLDELEITMKRDKDIRGLLIDSTTQLTFWGDGYAYLLNQRENDLCSTINVVIQHRCNPDDQFTQLIKGVIIVADGQTVKFDPIRCQVTAEIEDANFGTKIANNKRIEAFVNVGKSKNELDIDPAAATLVDFHETATGNYPGSRADRTGYKVSEVLRFMIDFMTDGLMGFESDFFTTGDGSDLYFFRGQEIRQGTGGTHPNIKFEELFNQLYRKYRISFTIVDGSTMKIEPEEDLLTDSEALTIDGLRTVQEYIDERALYAKVLLGSEDTKLTGDFPQIRFLGFAEEEYHMLGECNTENELDLRGVYLYDHNTIGDVFINDAYDEDVFIVQCEEVGGQFRSKQFDLFDLGLHFYNGDFRNSEVLKNFFGAIPNSVAAFLGDGEDNFKAGFTPPFFPSSAYILEFGVSNSEDPIIYDNDNDASLGFFDDNGNYSTVTGEYTIPADGLYNFSTTQVLEQVTNDTGLATFRIEIVKLDSGGSFIEVISRRNFSINIPGILPFIMTLDTYDQPALLGSLYFTSGQKVKTRITRVNGTGKYFFKKGFEGQQGCTFETLSVQNGGGIFETFDEKEVNLLMTEYETKVVKEDFNTMFNNRNSKILSTGLNDYRRSSFIEELKYTINTGDVSLKLFSKNT